MSKDDVPGEKRTTSPGSASAWARSTASAREFAISDLTTPLQERLMLSAISTILIGEMAESIKRSWSGVVKSEIANSLADAVERAHALAEPGEVVLFSPGTSSFDMFKSYADRGDEFRALVQTLPPLEP